MRLSRALALRRIERAAIPLPTVAAQSAGGVLALACMFFLMAAVYTRTRSEILISIDGQVTPFATHQQRVSEILRDAQILVAAHDVVTPALSAEVRNGEAIAIQRARDVSLSANGRTLTFTLVGPTVGSVLAQADVTLDPLDRVYLDGRRVSPDTRVERDGALVEVKRAVSVQLWDAGIGGGMLTDASTVAGLLAAEGLKLDTADIVTPPLSESISPGLRVTITRAKPTSVVVDGQTRQVRTQARQVRELLSGAGIAVAPFDLVDPSLEAPVTTNMSIKITRVQEQTVTEDIILGYATQMQADPGMEIDQQRLVQSGQKGLRRRAYLVRYEDGKEAARTLSRDWVERAPVSEVIAYGVNIVVRTMQTPDGPIEYWRTMRVWAMSYNASHGGRPRSSPSYGRTYLGWDLRYGIVAVDPRVIPFNTRIYVPGYGEAAAGDTGNFSGRQIDLAFEEDAPPGSWSSHWVDIRILTPVPAPENIRWVIP